MDGATAGDERDAILLLTAHAVGGSSRMAERARGAWASQHIADATTDHGLVAPACDWNNKQALFLAEMPALDAGGIALKLAQLVTQILRDFDGFPANVQNLALAASALADAVVLADGPIALPAGAMAGVREGDTESAAAWLARQQAATGSSSGTDEADAGR